MVILFITISDLFSTITIFGSVQNGTNKWNNSTVNSTVCWGENGELMYNFQLCHLKLTQ